MSRQPTWDKAVHIQGEMFETAADIGGLDMQVAFFRGQGEFRKSPWLASGADLAKRMSRVECRGGLTQIERLLNHTLREAEEGGVDALVYVGDAMEENADHLCARAGELGLRGVRGFFFQEGHDADVAAVYKEMARLSGGAYAAFDMNSAEQLRALLKAVATYAAGGHNALKALHDKGDKAAQRLLPQMKGEKG